MVMRTPRLETGQAPDLAGPRPVLLAAFDAVIAAVHPDRCLRPHLCADAWHGRTLIVALGKAAVPMAAVACDVFGDRVEGVVVTRYGHCGSIILPAGLELIESAHPVPDTFSQAAAAKVLEQARSLGRDDRLIALVSGGGSALLASPGHGVTLDEKQAISKALLASGASIAEINCVRMHLSAIKGGRLALAASPARVETYCISDVPGDDPALIASGPTVPCTATAADARGVLERHCLAHHARVIAALHDPRNALPPADDPAFANGRVRVIATSRDAMAAAAASVEAAGYRAVILGEVEGLAGEAAQGHAAQALEWRTRGEKVALISGGECTVRLSGAAGRGGPNSEYALALAIHLQAATGISALACDTDGIDGSGDNAGAIIDPTTLARAAALGLDARAALASNRSHDFFAQLGDLVTTGPTLSNVNDIRIVLFDPA